MNAKPNESGAPQPGQSPQQQPSLQERHARAVKKSQAYAAVAASPDLSPQAAARNLGSGIN